MNDFKSYFYGQSPDWTPDLQYGIIEDVETGEGIPLADNVSALIPFCAYSYYPPYKHKFGVESTAKLNEVYPFVQLVHDDGTFINAKGENVFLPSNTIKDQKRLINIAFQHIQGPANDWQIIGKQNQDKIYQLCQNKAEEKLLENPGDVAVHPHDPDYESD